MNGQRLRAGCVWMAAMWMTAAAAESSWHPFTWVDTATPGLASKKAALLLPVELDGNACAMQLDTGAGSSVLYRHSLPPGYAVQDAHLVVDRFSVGDLQARHRFRLMYDDAPAQRAHACLGQPGTSVAGTLANDVFAAGRLVLDLHNARFRFTPSAPPAAGQEDTGTPFTLMRAGDGLGEVPAIDAVLADGRHVPLLFDTGSAAAELGVFREADWLALVGPAGARDAVISTPMAWGRPLHCRSAPIEHAVQVGPIKLDVHTRALFCVGEHGQMFDKLGQFGLVGLAPFAGRVITLDYAARRFSVASPAAQ